MTQTDEKRQQSRGLRGGQGTVVGRHGTASRRGGPLANRPHPCSSSNKTCPSPARPSWFRTRGTRARSRGRRSNWRRGSERRRRQAPEVPAQAAAAWEAASCELLLQLARSRQCAGGLWGPYVRVGRRVQQNGPLCWLPHRYAPRRCFDSAGSQAQGAQAPQHRERHRSCSLGWPRCLPSSQLATRSLSMSVGAMVGRPESLGDGKKVARDASRSGGLFPLVLCSPAASISDLRLTGSSWTRQSLPAAGHFGPQRYRALPSSPRSPGGAPGDAAACKSSNRAWGGLQQTAVPPCRAPGSSLRSPCPARVGADCTWTAAQRWACLCCLQLAAHPPPPPPPLAGSRPRAHTSTSSGRHAPSSSSSSSPRAAAAALAAACGRRPAPAAAAAAASLAAAIAAAPPPPPARVACRRGGRGGAAGAGGGGGVRCVVRAAGGARGGR